MHIAWYNPTWYYNGDDHIPKPTLSIALHQPAKWRVGAGPETLFFFPRMRPLVNASACEESDWPGVDSMCVSLGRGAFTLLAVTVVKGTRSKHKNQQRRKKRTESQKQQEHAGSHSSERGHGQQTGTACTTEPSIKEGHVCSRHHQTPRSCGK
jgi:hypothetical protein